MQGLVSKEKIRGQYDGTCAPALPARCSLLVLQESGWQCVTQSLPDGCELNSHAGQHANIAVPTCIRQQRDVLFILFGSKVYMLMSVLQSGQKILNLLQ